MNRVKLFPNSKLTMAALLSPFLLILASNGYADNIHATHNGVEPQNCLDSGCHAGIHEREVALDPNDLNSDLIPDAHRVMLTEVPGDDDDSNADGMPDKKQCAWCHKTVDLAQAPGTSNNTTANLRKRVDVRLCVLCHGKDPAPGMSLDKHKPFYKVNFADLDPQPDGAELYEMVCSGCHGSIEDSQSFDTASKIQEAIDQNEGGMGPLSVLSSDQIESIADALAQ